MAQRVSIFFIATMLAMPLIARAQTASHPDFTGAWKVTNIDMPENAGGSPAAAVAGSGDAEVLAVEVAGGLEAPGEDRAMTIRPTRMVSAPSVHNGSKSVKSSVYDRPVTASS
jgi:hypothetical protein